jgi:hypothetical protein
MKPERIENHQPLVCKHVFAGAYPDVVYITNHRLGMVMCFDCADAQQDQNQPVENVLSFLTPLSAHQMPTHIRGFESKFPEDGFYQLLEGEYCRQPDFPESPNA